MKSHREDIFEPSEYDGKYLWCLHCERAYKKDEYRLVVEKGMYGADFEMQMCPYIDCDADAVLDAWPWLKIKAMHDKYPEVPEHGTVYPMYD